MKAILFIVLVFLSISFITDKTNAQIKTKTNKTETITLYEYERYDKNGNNYGSTEAPTTEIRYVCPICKGASVLNKRSNRYGAAVMATCWRCNGKGHLVSYSGKSK